MKPLEALKQGDLKAIQAEGNGNVNLGTALNTDQQAQRMRDLGEFCEELQV